MNEFDRNLNESAPGALIRPLSIDARELTDIQEQFAASATKVGVDPEGTALGRLLMALRAS